MVETILAQQDYLLFAGGALLVFGLLHRWLRKGRRGGAVCIALWILVTGVLGGGWYLVDTMGRIERERTQRRVQNFAPTFAQDLGLMGHQEISPETPPDDR